MEPDAQMYKTYIDYMTPPAGCNTTALSECMVNDGLSGGPITSMMSCSQNVTGCEVKLVNDTSAYTDFNTFLQGNATAYTAALETVGLEIQSEYEATVTAHQADIAAIVTNYTTEVKALYKLWPGCNMTCVNASDIDDLLQDEPYCKCGCDPTVKVTDSTTAFNATTGDVEFAAEIQLTAADNSTGATDSGSGNTWLIVGVLVGVVVLGVVGYMFYKKKQGTGEVHEEGGEGEFRRF